MMPSPAPTALTNQAPKSFEEPERRQVVDCSEQKQGKQQREAASKCPILRPFADRSPPNALGRIKNEMSAIEHWNWQQVDEPEIYGK
jgi:hypothetical protein